MDADFQPPVFLFSDDVVSFGSVGALLSYVEPWDVTDAMRAFDAVGRRVKIQAEGVVRTRHSVGGGETVLDSSEATEIAAQELAHLLRHHVEVLRRAGRDVNIHSEDASLGDLIRAVDRWTRVR